MFVWDTLLSLVLIVCLLPLFVIRAIHHVWTRVLFVDLEASEGLESFYRDFKSSCQLVEIRPGRVINLLDTKTTSAKAKPTLVFCHGACSRMGHFNRLIRHFHSEGFRVIAFDMFGCGKSPIPRGADYSLPSHFEDLKSILNSFDSPFLLLGHSAGACLSLTLATQSNPNLLGVVALSPLGPSVYDQVSRNIRRSFSLPASLSWLVRPLLALYFNSGVFAAATHPSVVAVSTEGSYRNPVHMYLSFYRGFRLPPLAGPALRPVLILTGKEDGLTPPSWGWDAARTLGGKATMLEIADAGHAIAEEAPEVVIDHVWKFVANISN